MSFNELPVQSRHVARAVLEGFDLLASFAVVERPPSMSPEARVILEASILRVRRLLVENKTRFKGELAMLLAEDAEAIVSLAPPFSRRPGVWVKAGDLLAWQRSLAAGYLASFIKGLVAQDAPAAWACRVELVFRDYPEIYIQAPWTDPDQPEHGDVIPSVYPGEFQPLGDAGVPGDGRGVPEPLARRAEPPGSADRAGGGQ